MFSYYANEKSDDVMGGSTKTVQHSIKNISRNIKAGSSNLASETYITKKKHNDTYYVVAIATLSAPVSFSKKPNIPIAVIKVGQRV